MQHRNLPVNLWFGQQESLRLSISLQFKLAKFMIKTRIWEEKKMFSSLWDGIASEKRKRVVWQDTLNIVIVHCLSNNVNHLKLKVIYRRVSRKENFLASSAIQNFIALQTLLKGITRDHFSKILQNFPETFETAFYAEQLRCFWFRWFSSKMIPVPVLLKKFFWIEQETLSLSLCLVIHIRYH